MQKMTMWVGAAIVALSAAAVFAFGASPEPIPVVSTQVQPDAPSLVVHVAGEVISPGLVALGDGARVADAIAAAGGATPTARLGAINLATPVTDGQQVLVPSIADPGEDARGNVVDGKVAINRANLAELEQLPGVGSVLALRIAEHREAFGFFSAPEDLLDVPGIGEGKLDTMRDSILLP